MTGFIVSDDICLLKNITTELNNLSMKDETPEENIWPKSINRENNWYVGVMMILPRGHQIYQN